MPVMPLVPISAVTDARVASWARVASRMREPPTRREVAATHCALRTLLVVVMRPTRPRV